MPVFSKSMRLAVLVSFMGSVSSADDFPAYGTCLQSGLEEHIETLEEKRMFSDLLDAVMKACDPVLGRSVVQVASTQPDLDGATLFKDIRTGARRAILHAYVQVIFEEKQ